MIKKTMPNNPSTWVEILNNLPTEIAGAIMAVFISILRVIYDQHETRPMRILLEAGICGALSLTVSSGILALDLNVNWAFFAGGMIGYIGSTTIRTLSLRIIEKYVNKKV